MSRAITTPAQAIPVPFDSPFNFANLPPELILRTLIYLKEIRDKVSVLRINRAFRQLGQDRTLWCYLIPPSWNAQEPYQAYCAAATLHRALRKAPPPLPRGQVKERAGESTQEEAYSEEDLEDLMKDPPSREEMRYLSRLLVRAPNGHLLLLIENFATLWDRDLKEQYLEDILYCWLCPESLCAVGRGGVTTLHLTTGSVQEQRMDLTLDTLVLPPVAPDLLSACTLLKVYNKRPFRFRWDETTHARLPIPQLTWVDQNLCVWGDPDDLLKVTPLGQLANPAMPPPSESAGDPPDYEIGWFKRIGERKVAGYFFIEDEHGSVDGIRVWNSNTGTSDYPPLLLTGPIEDKLQITPEILVTIDRDGEIELFNLEEGKSLGHWKAHGDLPDDETIAGAYASGNYDLSLCLGSLEIGRPPLLLSGASNGEFKVWSLETRACLRTLSIPQGHADTMVVMAEQSRIYLSGIDGTIALEFYPDSLEPTLICLEIIE